MAHTYKELRKKTVKDLREIAKGVEEIQGSTQMNKEHLLEALCKSLKIDLFEHHHAVGVNKIKLKTQIKKLKKKRDDAAAAKKYDEHKFSLRAIHHLKRKLHKATV